MDRYVFRSNVLINSGYIDNDIGPYADGYWLYKVFLNNKIFLKMNWLFW